MSYYEVRLTEKQRVKFLLVAKIKLIERGWNMRDLAAELDRPVNSVYNFFSNKKRMNRFLAAEIAEALNMAPSEWSC